MGSTSSDAMMRRRRGRWIGTLACALLVSLTGAARGQVPDGALTGRWLKVRTSGEVALGYRDASIPLSYLSPRNAPIGYSIDLCRAIVNAMSTEGGRDLLIGWVRVTPESRIDAVRSGQVDLECGSTTSN